MTVVNKLILILLIFTSIAAYGQSDTLYISRLLSEPVRNDIFSKNAALNMEIAKVELNRVNYFFPKLPELSIEWETDKLTSNKGSNTYSAIISQEFEIFGQSSLRKEIADLRFRSAQFEFNTFAAELRYNYRTALNNVNASASVYYFIKEIQKINEEILNASRQRLNAGDVSELDHNLLKLETDRMNIELTEKEFQLKKDINVLNIYLRRNYNDQLQIIPDTMILNLSYSLNALNDLSVINRSDLRSLKLEADAANLESELTAKESYPNFTLSAGFISERKIISGDDVVPLNTFYRIDDKDKLFRFGISFALPVRINGLFNYNQGASRISELKSAILRNQYEIKKKQILTELRTNYLKYESTLRAVTVFREDHFLIDRSLELLMRGFQKGELSLQVFLDTKKRLYDLKLNYTEALRNHNQSVIELERSAEINLIK
jgi:outer membrane protein TolC